MNIETLNLNLLPVLRAVLEEGSASRAAARLNVTQSAVSNALGRLRRLLGDELVVRTGRGLSPTPRALELRDGLARGLEQLEAVVAPPAFDPATTRRTFVLADSEDFSELPRLAHGFRARFPLATFRLVTVTDPLGAVLAGAAEVVVAIGARGPVSLRRRRLGTTRLVRVVRRGGPLARRPPATWLHVPAVAVRAAGGDAAQRVAMLMPDFMSACLAVSQSDCFTLVPEHLARTLVPLLPIEPLDAVGPRRVTSMWWHARSHADPAARAFRALLLEVAQPAS
jgi:DNA-binding transcriptional LysR family regulator